ncbi:MAG: GxxExxY protein [Bacteroidales bacterium]|nr:GxxExxY protein [Bacteroidales bacterium]
MKREEYNRLSGEILDSAITVHIEMGPGLLESIYEYCLVAELRSRGIKAKGQVYLPLFYKGEKLGKDFRMDVLVENEIIIEIKVAKIMHPVYEAQLISYLSLADKRLGFLINFHVPLLKDGFKRFVNNF